MKCNFKRVISLLLSFTVLMWAVTETSLATKKVSLNKTSVTLSIGETTKLKLNGSAIKSAKSSNKKVASVSKKGIITAKKEGKTTVSVTGKNKKKYKCKVIVGKNLNLDAFVDKTSSIDLSDGCVGLTIYANDGNYDIYFGRWVAGISASAEDFYFTTRGGKRKYIAIGNRNSSKYTFEIKRDGKTVIVTVKRIKDKWKLIPEKTYRFNFK